MPDTILLFGATGTIGRATHSALRAAGHEVVAPTRAECDFSAKALATMVADHKPDAVVSCLTSRSGTPKDAQAVDYQLNSDILKSAVAADVPRFVLLSAICVQKPKLAFQRAKLNFEAELRAAPVRWTIVRPTAFFKSLSGQVDRLRAGKAFLLFGNGALTACKPISDRDLGAFVVQCLDEPAAENAVLPIGGPGPAMTPKEQGTLLFDALGLEPKFSRVPVAMMSGIIGLLSALGFVMPKLREKAELAKIGRYYATESMLVWDGARYDADATPEFGNDTLKEHYERIAAGLVDNDRGSHAVF